MAAGSSPLAGSLELALALFLLLLVVHQVRRRLQKLARLAYFDELTGLPNRTGFKREVERALAGASGRDTAVLRLDLDRFRQINDTLGHGGGTAAATRCCVRSQRASPRSRRAGS